MRQYCEAAFDPGYLARWDLHVQPWAARRWFQALARCRRMPHARASARCDSLCKHAWFHPWPWRRINMLINTVSKCAIIYSLSLAPERISCIVFRSIRSNAPLPGRICFALHDKLDHRLVSGVSMRVHLKANSSRANHAFFLHCTVQQWSTRIRVTEVDVVIGSKHFPEFTRGCCWFEH